MRERLEGEVGRLRKKLQRKGAFVQTKKGAGMYHDSVVSNKEAQIEGASNPKRNQ